MRLASDRPLRLMLVNWQDREHPQSGGAEVHLHEIFGRLASEGHEIRAVVGGWPGAEPTVTLDGIQVRRVGTRHTFPADVVRAVRRELAERPADLLIEDINKLPLCTPIWSQAPVVALVPHLFGTTAFTEASWPIAAAVWGGERLIPIVYRRTPFQAISPSTADDLVARGIPRANVTVIRPGIDHETFVPGRTGDRAPVPTVVYVGRLRRYKGLDTLIQAFAQATEALGRAKLLIAGRGDDRARLERVARELDLGEKVEFLGYVSEMEKVRLLQVAWLVAYPSPKEGWGILSLEAAACGTPVVASDSPGLRDSVAPDTSGVLVPHGDVASWAAALGRILTDSAVRSGLSAGAIEHAAGFGWARAAVETERHLRGVLVSRAVVGPDAS